MATVDEDNLVEREKRRAAIRERARIFREVLSTPHGKIVLDTLATNFKTGSGFPPNQLDNQGRTDALQTWRKLGHFDVLQYIQTQLDYKESEHVNSSSSGT